ncbi:hypothetical protein RJ641_030972, partial [Dillenia turbinata]
CPKFDVLHYWYPVPQCAETQGRSISAVGFGPQKFLIIVLSQPLSGPFGQMTWIRGGPKCLAVKNISSAIDNSFVPMFGETEYDPLRQFSLVHIEDQLEAFGRAIRYIGLSNETPYGLMKFLQVADTAAYPGIVSLQNSYNLLCRNFDSGLAECYHHERNPVRVESYLVCQLIGLQPSGNGYSLWEVLSGPAVARMNPFRGQILLTFANACNEGKQTDEFVLYSFLIPIPRKVLRGGSRYDLSNPTVKSTTIPEVLKYHKPSHFQWIYYCHASLSWASFVLRHPLAASAVFGSTKVEQLFEALEAMEIKLTLEIIADINEVDARFPNPSP